MTTTDAGLRRATVVLLRGGVLLASATLFLGLLGMVVHDPSEWARRFTQQAVQGTHRESLVEQLRGLASPDATLVLRVGLFLLVLVPIGRVVLSLVGFVRARDWRYTAITGAVLALLAVGVALGTAG